MAHAVDRRGEADLCGGRNISPPLLFSGAPPNARSFAIVAFDPDARAGHGFVHWVAYGIAAAEHELRAGFGSQASAAFTGGVNDAGTALYFGPCPPPGDQPHHYIFTAYALDLAPGRLQPGLTRARYCTRSPGIRSHRPQSPGGSVTDGTWNSWPSGAGDRRELGLGARVCAGAGGRRCTLAIGARRIDLLEAVADEARAAGSSEAHAYALDLSDPGSIEAMLAAMRDRQGDAEIFIANSGPPKAGAVANLTLADWDAAYGPTMRSMLQIVYAVLPAMRERGWGRIVNLASSALKAPIPNLALSNAFRAGLLGALKTLSREVASDGVTINVIATGKIETARARSFYSDPGAWEKQQREVPFGRFGTPEEFAPWLLFCAARARSTSAARRSPSTEASRPTSFS